MVYSLFLPLSPTLQLMKPLSTSIAMFAEILFFGTPVNSLIVLCPIVNDSFCLLPTYSKHDNTFLALSEIILSLIIESYLPRNCIKSAFVIFFSFFFSSVVFFEFEFPFICYCIYQLFQFILFSS